MKKLFTTNLFILFILLVSICQAQHNFDDQSILYSNNGYVGIGTFTPSKLLTISSGANVYLRIEKPSYPDHLDFGIATHTGTISYKAGTSTFSNIVFLTNDISRFQIGHDGNIGIGTTNPTSLLSLGEWNSGSCGTLGGTQMRISGTHNTGANLGGIKLLIEGHDNDGSITYPLYIKDENSNIDYWIKNRSSGSDVPTMFFAGNIGVGTTTPDYELDVNGTIRAQEVKVNMDGADFVFEDDYQLQSLSDVESYIKENKHLPDIAPAKEMQENGISVGEMDAKLLQKIEELTLYLIEVNKKVELLKVENMNLKNNPESSSKN